MKPGQIVLGLFVMTIAACTATPSLSPVATQPGGGYPGPNTSYPGPATTEPAVLPVTPAVSPFATPNASASTPGALYLPLIGEDNAGTPAANSLPTATPEIKVVPTDTPQPPPPPSPTPTPAWPEPLAGQTASKISLHVVFDFDPYLIEFVRRVHPRVINAPDDPTFLTKVKSVSPNTITLSRKTQPGEGDWIKKFDPVESAHHYVRMNMEHYQKYPAVDYWLGQNEVNPGSPEEWKWYAQFEATRACDMQAAGLKAAVGDFGVGWPGTYEQFEWFFPALEAAYRCGGIFTIHEYNAPDFARGVSVNVPGIIPGAPALNVPAGPYTLRYRFWYESFLKPRGLGELKLVITELGALGGPADGGECVTAVCTWKNYQTWWVKQGLGATGPEAFVNMVAWYDAELRKDSYVIGATLFTSGQQWPEAPWYSHDVHDALVPLAQYEARQQ